MWRIESKLWFSQYEMDSSIRQNFPDEKHIYLQVYACFENPPLCRRYPPPSSGTLLMKSIRKAAGYLLYSGLDLQLPEQSLATCFKGKVIFHPLDSMPGSFGLESVCCLQPEVWFYTCDTRRYALGCLKRTEDIDIERCRCFQGLAPNLPETFQFPVQF